MIDLIRDDPAPFLWLFVYLFAAGALVVTVAVAVLRWFRGVIGTDDLAQYLYLDRPRTLYRRREYVEDESGRLVGRWIVEEVHHG